MFGSLSNRGGSLFDEILRGDNDMDEFFGRWPWPASIRSVARGTFPPINVGASPEQVSIYIFAAGLDPETLDISMHQNLLTVSGERSITSEKDANYYRQERFSGPFRRVVTLPEDVDPDQAEACYRDGVLQIDVKRREAARPRQIEVK